MDPELEEDDTTCEATEGTLSQTGVLSLVWRKDVLGAAWVESSSSVDPWWEKLGTSDRKAPMFPVSCPVLSSE